jgi:argininosuccinate synthase
MGSNLWGRTMARDAALAPDGSARPLTSARAAAPAEAASVDIRFERGVPVSVNGVSMPLVELIGTIAHLAASQGVGSVVTGAAVVEAPAAIVLHAAHRALAGTTRSRERQRVARQYANIVASGEWATPARAKLDREVERLDEPLNGSVTVRLFRGQHELIIPSGSRA